MSPNTCIKFCILSLCMLSLMWIHLPILESDCGHLAAYTRLNAQSWEAEIGVRFWTSSTRWGGWWWGICKLHSTKLWQNWRLTSSLALYHWHLALRCDHVLSFIGNTLEISVKTNAAPEPSWAPPLLLHIFFNFGSKLSFSTSFLFPERLHCCYIYFHYSYLDNYYN